MTDKPWLALAIGNSRLHWAHLVGSQLQAAWDTTHFLPHQIQQLAAEQLQGKTVAQMMPTAPSIVTSADTDQPPLSLWIASVIPRQTQEWQVYPHSRVLTLSDVPLGNIYPTLGLDRALALWGAGQLQGFPVLVIDAGTALTFTGADTVGNLVGGAILPGIRAQFQTLNQLTAQLPLLTTHNWMAVPERWARETPTAIASGIIHTILASVQAFVADWQHQFPTSAIALTGGDAPFVMGWLKIQSPKLAGQIYSDPTLVIQGMRFCDAILAAI
jgi:type III pantothenate kinase